MVMEEVLRLILTQYQNRSDGSTDWEIMLLQKASEKGILAFGEACSAVFGKQLSAVLYAAIENAQHCNQRFHDRAATSLEAEETVIAVRRAQDIARACSLIHLLQRLYQCDLIPESKKLIKKAADLAEAIKKEKKQSSN